MKRLISLLLGASFGIAGFAGAATAQEALPGNSEPLQNLPNLVNTEWRLTDLAGASVDRIQTTLRFDAGDRISGQGGCNRYMSQVQFAGDGVSVSPIASTRMLCEPAAMTQEASYFQALQNAQRIETEGASLLIFSEGSDAPLRFARLNATRPTEMNTLVFFEGDRNTVRVYVQNGETRMNVHDRQNQITWTRGVPVQTRETREGTVYTNTQGEATIAVIVPRSGEPPRLVINGEVDR